MLHESFKKLQGLGPTQTNSLDSLRVGPGVGCFSKAPRCFQGAAEGEDYYFIVSLGELHVIKLYCLLACLIIPVILVV